MKKFIEKWSVPLNVLFIVCFILLYFSEAQIPTIFTSSGIVAILSAIIGVLLTAFAVSGQLNKQSENEEKKDKNIKVFEKKQEIYHQFLEKFKKIIQDGKIKIAEEKADGTIDNSVDELKDLIFQLAYLQMHIKEEENNSTIDIVLKGVEKIIKAMNDFNSEEAEKQKEKGKYYSILSSELFNITAALKADLYDGTCVPVEESKMTAIFDQCDILTTEIDKYAMQTHFWEELKNQLISYGYELYPDFNSDFKQQVIDFYGKTKRNTQRSGMVLKICESIKFTVTSEINEFFYGIRREHAGDNPERLVQMFKNVSTLSASNKSWPWWKYPDKYRLDFVNLTAREFTILNNPNKRDKFIKKLADEIDGYIKKIIEIVEAEENRKS